MTYYVNNYLLIALLLHRTAATLKQKFTNYLLETKSEIMNPDQMLLALKKEGRLKLAAGPLGLSVSVYVGSVRRLNVPHRKPSIPMITTLGDFIISDEGWTFQLLLNILNILVLNLNFETAIIFQSTEQRLR